MIQPIFAEYFQKIDRRLLKLYREFLEKYDNKTDGDQQLPTDDGDS